MRLNVGLSRAFQKRDFKMLLNRITQLGMMKKNFDINVESKYSIEIKKSLEMENVCFWFFMVLF